MEEEEYKAFLEREVGEDLHNLVTVDTNEAIGVPGDVKTVEDGDQKHEVKKKKGKKEREQEKEKDDVHCEKALKKRNKKSKEETDKEFLMKYVKIGRTWSHFNCAND